jgi:hypothetical protein
MTLELSDNETLALADLLKRAIDRDRYPLSPRIQTLKAILAKIEPQPAATTAAPRATKAGDRPSAVLASMRRRRRG